MPYEVVEHTADLRLKVSGYFGSYAGSRKKCARLLEERALRL